MTFCPKNCFLFPFLFLITWGFFFCRDTKCPQNKVSKGSTKFHSTIFRVNAHHISRHSSVQLEASSRYVEYKNGRGGKESLTLSSAPTYPSNEHATWHLLTCLTKSRSQTTLTNCQAFFPPRVCKTAGCQRCHERSLWNTFGKSESWFDVPRLFRRQQGASPIYSTAPPTVQDQQYT